jgi:hypothetical protein
VRFGVANASMRMALAVVEEINGKADENMRHARKVATAYRELAGIAREILTEGGRVSFERCRDIEALAGLREAVLEVVEVLPVFMGRFRRFRADHGPLIESDVAGTLEAFDSWVQALPRLIDTPWRGLLAELDSEIREQSEEARAVAAEWAVVDKDGLDQADA